MSQKVQSPMMHAVYNLIVIMATPFLMLYIWFRPQYRILINRFFPTVSPLDSPPIWIQGASVGEVLTARPIIEGLKHAYPDIPIVLTTGTATGMEEAVKWCEDVAWFPFDHPWTVRLFFKRLKPRCIVLVETELWPNVLHRAHQSNIPVVIVNGRLSEKHFGRYERYKGFFQPYLNSIRLAAMQTELDAERIHTLGIPNEAIRITGNLKFDGAALEPDTQHVQTLRRELGIAAECPIVVFGSTRSGEERAFIASWKHIKRLFPDL